MARSQHLDIHSDRSIDHDIDRIIERIRQDIPDIPYYLSVPSEYPYRLLNPTLRDQWRKDTWFEPHEEHLQYSTFVWRDSATSPFQLYPFPADEPRVPVEQASTLTPTPSNVPKKKITLAAYKNKSKASASHAAQAPQDLPRTMSPAPGTPGPSSQPTVHPPQRMSGKNGATDSQAVTALRSSGASVEVKKLKPQTATATEPELTTQKQDFAMGNMPWLPTPQDPATFEHLPPRLSPLIPADSILHMPSPGALQRHALSTLVGSKSSPLQVTLSLPSTFATEPETSTRHGQEQALRSNPEDDQPSLVVKLHIPSLKQRKKRSTDANEDEPNSKRPRADVMDRANGHAVSTPRKNGATTVDSPQTSPTALKGKTTAAEWQAETVRLSKLGKISKSTSAEVFKESETLTDLKEQARMRKVAGIRALEALLRFLQSFVAKSQSRPNPRGLLLDWISFMPYSSDVVAVTRHFSHLQGLALLLQSIASAQIVAVCGSMRVADDASNSNKDDSNAKEANETLSTLQKYGLYTQQKSAEAGKILTRRILAQDYPKAYAASLEQPLGSGLQPMPAFRMAVQLLDEWSSHQGIEWQPLDEGLCSRL